jgi:hypothetical protein
MKNNLVILCVTMLMSIASYAQDPTADQIIDKYIATIGGKEVIAKIEDAVMNSSFEMNRGGQAMTIETETRVKGKKFASISYAMGNESNRMVCDGNKVFMSGRMGGGDRTLEGKDAIQAILQGVLFPELYYAEYNLTKVLAGKEAINGKDAWKIEVAIPEGKKWTTYYDVASGLKVRTTIINESPRGTQTQNVSYDNYKEVNGVKFPFLKVRNFGQFEMKDEVATIKINKGVKDNAFEIK